MTCLLADCAGGWGVGLLVLAGVYATMSLGTSGGPNHGEHPFTTNVVHLAVSFWTLRGWPAGPRWTYMGILGAAVLLSVFAFPLRAHFEPRRVWVARAAMAALYVGLLAVVLRVVR
jgi:hypothetical protein